MKDKLTHPNCPRSLSGQGCGSTSARMFLDTIWIPALSPIINSFFRISGVALRPGLVVGSHPVWKGCVAAGSPHHSKLFSRRVPRNVVAHRTRLPCRVLFFAHWVRHHCFSHVSTSLELPVLVVPEEVLCVLHRNWPWSSIFAQSRLSLERKSWRCVRKRFFDDRMLQRTHAICRELCVSGTDIRLPQGWPLSGHCRNSIFGA